MMYEGDAIFLVEHLLLASIALISIVAIVGAHFFCSFFLGGMDIHYTNATIATSRVCEVHHKPKRPRLTTHSELVQA